MTDSVSEKEGVVPMSKDELRRRLDLRDALIQSPPEMSVTDIVEDRIASLIDEKGRFRHIFRTGKGSIYFVLKDGSVQRIKLADKTTPVQNLHNYLFFLEDVTAQRLVHNPKIKQILTQEGVKVVPLQEGAYPMDFGKSDSPESKYTLEGDSLTIHGDDKGLIHGFHIGNQVTEIVK